MEKLYIISQVDELIPLWSTKELKENDSLKQIIKLTEEEGKELVPNSSKIYQYAMYTGEDLKESLEKQFYEDRLDYSEQKTVPYLLLTELMIVGVGSFIDKHTLYRLNSNGNYVKMDELSRKAQAILHVPLHGTLFLG